VQPSSVWQTPRPTSAETWAVPSICTAAWFCRRVYCIDDSRSVCRQEVVNFSLFVDKQEDPALVLLLHLSDNCQNHAQKQYRSSLTGKDGPGGI
jgi:hypothetical protein